MIYALFGIILILLIVGPRLWVGFVLARHRRPLENMPGTGAELAIHLLKKFELSQVKVERTEKDADHYSPVENAVRLSPEVYSGKSLTAIAVASHEVGHAIQFNRKEPVSLLRERYLPKAHLIQRYGVYILMALPAIGAIVRIPHIIILTAIIGVATMLASVLMYAAILPEEWDASFNKALPILEQGDYVPEQYMPAVRQVLKACALTYVAAALADVLRLWRWLALLKAIR